MPWALIDPNWGEPKPVLGTIRDSEESAWAAAVSPRADPECRLYSGASEYPYPSGTPGQVDVLKMHGFTVQKVGVAIEAVDDIKGQCRAPMKSGVNCGR